MSSVKTGEVPPCPFGSKSTTNDVHIRAARLARSRRAGSSPNFVMFWTGFAKTKGIYSEKMVRI